MKPFLSHSTLRAVIVGARWFEAAGSKPCQCEVSMLSGTDRALVIEFVDCRLRGLI